MRCKLKEKSNRVTGPLGLHDDLITNFLKPTLSNRPSNYYAPINFFRGGWLLPLRDLTAYPILSPYEMLIDPSKTSRLHVQSTNCKRKLIF